MSDSEGFKRIIAWIKGKDNSEMLNEWCEVYKRKMVRWLKGKDENRKNEWVKEKVKEKDWVVKR